MGVPAVPPGVTLVYMISQNSRAVRKSTNQRKSYKPVDPPGVTLNLLILQVLTKY